MDVLNLSANIGWSPNECLLRFLCFSQDFHPKTGGRFSEILLRAFSRFMET